jgi:hypothetical protein
LTFCSMEIFSLVTLNACPTWLLNIGAMIYGGYVHTSTSW